MSTTNRDGQGQLYRGQGMVDTGEGRAPGLDKVQGKTMTPGRFMLQVRHALEER